MHYFESVSDSLRKLTPNDYCSFVEKILFSEEATSEVKHTDLFALLHGKDDSWYITFFVHRKCY